MEKKIYTTPALSVEEFKMSEIVCASGDRIQTLSTGGVFNDVAPQGGDGTGNSAARGNSRGIWDEE